MDIENLRSEDRAKLSSTGKKFFKFIEFDKDERLICEIRKHAIGLFFIYLTGFSIAIIITLVFGLVVSSEVLSQWASDIGTSSGTIKILTVIFSIVFISFILIAMTIQSILYSNNVIYVTSEKIAQILYINLFNRKISQLSIGDVQDVTVTQKGVLAHMFNFGTLVIETAGEQQNYTFTYIPDPYVHSKAIVGAHERNLVQYGN